MRQRLLEFSAASASSQGARADQEDCTRLWYPNGADANPGQHSAVLAVLADGMGGHVSGETASRLACEGCVQHFSSTQGELARKVETVLGAANASLGRAIESNSRLSGMGCTLIAAHLDRDGVRWASVGDSALLLFREEQLYRLNDNHSLGALLDKQAAAKIITYEEAYNSPNRQSLRSALTGTPIAITDIVSSPQPLLPADWLILSSDGLDTLTGDEVATIMGNSRDAAPADLIRVLLSEVDRRAIPNQDNTSVIALRIHAVHRNRDLTPARSGVDDDVAAPGRDDVGDTQMIVPTIRGTLVGRVRQEREAAPTILIAKPRSRNAGYRGNTLVALLIVIAASVLLVAYVMSTSDGARPTSEPLEKQELSADERRVEPSVAKQDPPTPKTIKRKGKETKESGVKKDVLETTEGETQTKGDGKAAPQQ